MTTEQKYKAIKSRLNINDDDVGRVFGLGEGKTRPGVQLSNSSAKMRYIEAFIKIFELIGDRQKSFFDLDQ